MAVVTSDFHMPRSRAIFEWVFGLQGAGTSIQPQANNRPVVYFTTGSRSQGFILQYHSVSDDGIDPSIIEVSVALTYCNSVQDGDFTMRVSSAKYKLKYEIIHLQASQYTIYSIWCMYDALCRRHMMQYEHVLVYLLMSTIY